MTKAARHPIWSADIEHGHLTLHPLLVENCTVDEGIDAGASGKRKYPGDRSADGRKRAGPTNGSDPAAMIYGLRPNLQRFQPSSPPNHFLDPPIHAG